jgi:DNA-binding transcriptional ArsR family regulator
MLSSTNSLDLVFKALGDPTRRKLLARLAKGPAMVTDLARPFGMSLPAVGKHIRVLEKAGLVKRTVTGRVHRCALNARPLKNAGDWLRRYQRFWDETLDSLNLYLQDEAD